MLNLLKNLYRKNPYFSYEIIKIYIILLMYLFCFCVRAHLYVRTQFTKQIFYFGLSARKTLALRGKVYNSLVTTFL
nr:MAG TPA: hypothetical protein [Microviridae sp.]